MDASSGLSTRQQDSPFSDVEWLRVGEAKYADMAEAHRERKEWVAALRAAEVSDAIRFYRLHREAVARGAVTP